MWDYAVNQKCETELLNEIQRVKYKVNDAKLLYAYQHTIMFFNLQIFNIYIHKMSFHQAYFSPHMLGMKSCFAWNIFQEIVSNV